MDKRSLKDKNEGRMRACGRQRIRISRNFFALGANMYLRRTHMTRNNLPSARPSLSVSVSSEIGRLRRLLVHSPDSGLGKVVPSKAQDWLFEDIVHLDTIRRKEYDFYTKVLLYFLDPEKIKGRLSAIDDEKSNRRFYKPGDDQFFRSDKVVELQWLLADILTDHEIKLKLVASVCAIEACSYDTQKELQKLSPVLLAKTFISGTLNDEEMLFAPIPNFIFTRDIGIVINDHVLLNKPAKKARTREALLAKYIFFNHALFATFHQKIIELSDTHHHFLLPREGDDKKVTLEGGDVMVVSKEHLLIGVSERTTQEAAHQAIKILFEKNVVKKITILRIPKKRDYMHIDTLFTQVKRNVWIMLGIFSKKTIKHEDEDTIERILEGSKKEDKLRIIQFRKKDTANPEYFDSLEDLLTDISRNDLGCTGKIRFIYSGNNEVPFDAREQWTDSCNLLALKEGVVLGYDRNDKTIEAFKSNGFEVIHAHDLIVALEKGEIDPDAMEDTLILMPSAELSRARGGFHCMSMPLLRDELE
jgi:arginine deiminase